MDPAAGRRFDAHGDHRAGTASHHHAVLSADSGAFSEEFVTRHNPFSTASHLHAILKIVELDPC
jgi:hypothetical protein